uniref:Serine/threonine protein kinase n=1 Tax=Rhizophora mucronata TaxID=61149 RepID=A0A2P2J0H8_RHIMU
MYQHKRATFISLQVIFIDHWTVNCNFPFMQRQLYQIVSIKLTMYSLHVVTRGKGGTTF